MRNKRYTSITFLPADCSFNIYIINLHCFNPTDPPARLLASILFFTVVKFLLMLDNYLASLLFTMTEHDQRIFFAFDLSSKRFVYANPTFGSFFQVPFTAATPKLLLAMVHPEDLDYLKESYASLQPDNFKNNVEFRMLLPDKKNMLFI